MALPLRKCWKDLSARASRHRPRLFYPIFVKDKSIRIPKIELRIDTVFSGMVSLEESSQHGETLVLPKFRRKAVRR